MDELLRHQEWLARVARRAARDPHAAEDALQATWLLLLRRRPAAAQLSKPWLGRVLRNELLRALRMDGRRRARESLRAEPGARDVDPAAAAEDAEAAQRISGAIERLDEPYRSTVRLRYDEGLSSVAIAALQQIPPATVRWRLMVAAGLLRSELHRRRAPPGPA